MLVKRGEYFIRYKNLNKDLIAVHHVLPSFAFSKMLVVVLANITQTWSLMS